MDPETKADLIGFALATAVVSLQLSEAHVIDDITGMLDIIESEYSPETAAAHFWAASQVLPKGGEDRFGYADRLPSDYWQRFEFELNDISTEVAFQTYRENHSNVIDFMAYYRKARGITVGS